MTTHSIPTATGSLAISDTGPAVKAQGDPVVMLHGFTDCRDSWNSLAAKVRRKHRVITIDLAGHGDSGRVGNDRYDLKSQAKRVVSVVDHLGIGAHHIIGHSMGGGVASFYAVENAERVRSLALVASTGLANVQTDEFNSYLNGGKNPLIVTSEWSFADKLYFVTEKPSWRKPFLWAFGRGLQRVELAQADLYRQIYSQIAKDQMSPDELHSIRCPVLIVWGMDDRVLRPELASEFQAGLTSASLVEIHTWEGAGHMAHQERRRETARCYGSFLEKVNAPD